MARASNSPAPVRAARVISAMLVLPFAIIVATGCTSAPASPDSSTQSPPSTSDAQGGTGADTFPDIVSVDVTQAGDDTFDFDVTVSSPYDTAKRYADGWRILTADGDLLGEHELTHDHATEQPFTRTQSGVEIPADVTEVTVEGRDQANGYGGDTQTVQLPGR